jgi:DNA polymerase-4
MGSQHALGRRSPKSHGALDELLVAIVDRLTLRLRKARRACRTVTLRLRFDDFSRATRAHTLLESTFETRTILAVARELLAAAMPMIEERGVTLVGLSLSNLDDDDAVQLALPLERRSVSALDSTVDELRERFGSDAITRASQLTRRLRPAVPMLPD